ncbi:glycosyltransferase family 87 protein [Vulgatibacter incomptus]|uniref:DUF2029 domain-containing protein n=1 Tax=Vulgatibacter incomptus TaxID=1391653 RepID=A0A0K1P8F8_9BACT|nr:glycosyltransferase family 87 protein [Vulgatibacter incomptus]AKU89813.1 hypothetical protein AKJ08_0200 [Vulgatibacter incomptus]
MGRWFLAAALVIHLAVVFGIARVAIERQRDKPAGHPTPMKLFNDVVHRVGPGADFFALYHAAVALERDGKIYGGGNDRITPPYYVYRYLPILAQTAGRLARLLPPWSAYLVWLAIIEGLLAVCLVVTLRLFPGSVGAWLCSLWLLYTPHWLELWMGQFSFVTGALVFIAGALLASGRPKRSLVPWIAGVGVKIYPLVLLPLLWRKRVLPLAALVLAALVLANLPGFLYLPDAWSTFSDANLAPAERLHVNAGHYGLSYVFHLAAVKGFALRDGVWPIVYRAVSLLALGGAALAVARRRDPPVLASIALLMLAHQVSYKHVWEHHYSMVLPMGILLLRHHLGEPRVAWTIVASLIVMALPTPFALWDRPGGDPTGGWTLFQQIAVPAAKALPALVLYVVALRALLRPVPSTAESPSLSVAEVASAP